jgi:hypothetical protein
MPQVMVVVTPYLERDGSSAGEPLAGLGGINRYAYDPSRIGLLNHPLPPQLRDLGG